MSHEDVNEQELDRLVVRLQEGDLTEEEQASLVRVIRNDPTGRRRLVEHMYLSADLRDQLRHSTDLLEGSRRKPIHPVVWVGSTLAAAAAIAFAVVKFNESNPSVEPPIAGDPSIGSEVGEGGIAVLVRQSVVEWGEATSMDRARLELGEPLVPGVLELKSGVVQIDFYSGASVVLEGPARMELRSPELGVLDYGRLRARVPVPARGFRVLTSNFEVLDLGTEFAMELGMDGQGKVHVIDGEVEVYGAGERDGERLLTAGQGLAIDEEGTRRDIESSLAGFASVEELSSEADRRYAAWKDFRDEFRKDPDLLVYYTFDGEEGWGRQEENLALHGPEETDGAIVGCQPVEGRWPQKMARCWNNSSDRVRLRLPGEHDQLTLACWVKVDRFAQRRIALLHPETSQDRFLHWGLQVGGKQDDLHMHFAETRKGADNPSGDWEERQHYHCDRPVQVGLTVGEWMHLAVVYDSVAAEVRHYKNGELYFTNAIEHPRPISVGVADIGNWPYKEWAAGTPFEVRNLNGCMGEFLVSRRAMGPDELARLFEVGQP